MFKKEIQPTDGDSFHASQVPSSSRKQVFSGRVVIFLCVLLSLAYCFAYAWLFVVPRQVNFAYAQDTCRKELTLFPASHGASSSSSFKVAYVNTVSPKQTWLVSTQTCFIPVAAPQTGEQQLATAPFGIKPLQAKYRLVVGEPPRFLSETSVDAHPLARPLKLQMNQPDKIFKYQLFHQDSKQQCDIDATDLACSMDKLGLQQGTSYTLKLIRSFGNQQVGETKEVKVSILPAVIVTGSSIKEGETVYSRPKSVELTFNKPLVSLNVRFEAMDGEKATPIATKTKLDGQQAVVSWDEELTRDKTFRLTSVQAESTDGSRLGSSHTLLFKTSAGPKVSGVSIGAGGVPGNARVIVTFDQALAKNLDVTKFASITGGAAAISRQGSNQIVFALQGFAPCAPFTLNIAKGIVGENGMVSTSAWSHASRISCRMSRVIGYSVKARPIEAYFYGSGGTAILFTGGIHGNEPSGVTIMQDWAAQLDIEGYKIPANKQIVIVPNINPDGIAINQRYNANNVNLDRNFPSSDWVKDIAVRNGEIVVGGGGSAPLSEPEARAVANLTSSLNLRVMISFHAQGSLVGINKVKDSAAIGNLYASSVGYRTMFDNAEQIMGYTFTGEYETWIGEKLGAPAVLIELPRLSGRYFSAHQKTLWRMIDL